MAQEWASAIDPDAIRKTLLGGQVKVEESSGVAQHILDENKRTLLGQR